MWDVVWCVCGEVWCGEGREGRERGRGGVVWWWEVGCNVCGVGGCVCVGGGDEGGW